MVAIRRTPEARVNDPREIRGWLRYKWASAGFETTVATVLAGPYLTALAQRAVGINGTIWRRGALAVTAKSLFPYCVAVSVVLQVLLIPAAGILAAYTRLEKRLMAMSCYTGVTATCPFVFITERSYVLGAALLVVANLAFGVTFALYNAFS